MPIKPKLLLFRHYGKWWCKTNSKHIARMTGMYLVPTTFGSSVPADEVLWEMRQKTGYNVKIIDHLKVFPTLEEMNDEQQM